MTKIIGIISPFSSSIRGNIGSQADILTNPVAGIYQMRKCLEGKIPIKMKFYRPTNPRTIKQQANRIKLRDAVIAWSLLTDAEKNVYHERAKSWHYWGYHLFVSEYMKKP